MGTNAAPDSSVPDGVQHVDMTQVSAEQKMAAMDSLTPSLRQIVLDSPLPINVIDLARSLRLYGEARVLLELKKFHEKNFPGFKPLQRRQR